MFILCHLAAGLVIGFLLAWSLHDSRWVLPVAVGAVIPDIVDKPLGTLVLTIGYGRIYSHTLLFFLVLLGAGLALWAWKRSVILAGVSVGVLSHQLLDAMFAVPANWFHPFFGPFTFKPTTDFWWTALYGELSSPTEWVLGGAVALGLLLWAFPGVRERLIRPENPLVFPSLVFLSGVTGLMGVVILLYGWSGRVCPLTGWHSLTDNAICGLVMIGAAVVIFVAGKRLSQAPVRGRE